VIVAIIVIAVVIVVILSGIGLILLKLRKQKKRRDHKLVENDQAIQSTKEQTEKASFETSSNEISSSIH
jgi:type II secretory pathway pseudopilin PulG